MALHRSNKMTLRSVESAEGSDGVKVARVGRTVERVVWPERNICSTKIMDCPGLVNLTNGI